MGMGRAAIALLLEEAAARPFYGRLATLRPADADTYEKAIEFRELRTAKKCLWVGANLR
jgi:hypothetical protein